MPPRAAPSPPRGRHQRPGKAGSAVARVPQNLLGSLKLGGRLAAIVGDEPMMRAHFITRVSEGQWNTIQPWDTVAPRLLNFPEPSRFNF